MPPLDSEIPGWERCSVHVAHRRHLRDAHRGLLDDREIERRRRYRLAADRDRFTLAAVLLRTVAGRAIGVDPAAVVIDRICESCGEPHGRPRLPGSGLEVSISHSGHLVAVAVTAAGPVGVDIERVGVAHPDLASTVCAGSELRHVHTAEDFYAYWTRKEAVLKATGDGLRRPMTTVVVTPPTVPPTLISLDGRPGVAGRLADLRLGGYAGAVAVLTGSNVVFDVADAHSILPALRAQEGSSR